MCCINWSIFGFKKKNELDINEAVGRLANLPEAKLIDVREPDEYRRGHIPGSMNCSVRDLAPVTELIQDKNTPIYVYCQSGARSGRAKKLLEQAGYTNVTNLGGIMSYKGDLDKNFF